jgi:aerobic-type carbon monoxide dehydrogenase small subunit (CoxS/CutS family)
MPGKSAVSRSGKAKRREYQMKQWISLQLNGERVETEVEPSWTLLYLIRETLGLTGTKEACSMGECGVCTVIVNGHAIASCIFPVIEVDGAEVWTIEGLSNSFSQEIHFIQKAFLDEGAVQCGYCTPGMIMSTKALLDSNSNPSTDEIRTAIEGNLCRCGGYPQIVKAIKSAAESVRAEKGKLPKRRVNE